MTMRLVLLGILGLLALDSPPRAAEKTEAFDRAALQADIKSIGVLPVFVPHTIPHRKEVARRYEAEAVGRLETSGFKVVGPDAMREIEVRLAKSVGGLYDPLTGEPNKEKFEAHERFARTEYLERHRVDAFLQMVVISRTARSESSKARWDGVEERVTGQSGFKSFITGATGNLGEGTVPALSLAAYLEDRHGKVRFAEIAGLQLLGYIRMGWVPKQFDVDPHHLLKDPARDARAFAILFDPLTGQSTAGKAKLELAPVMVEPESPESVMSRERLLGEYRRVALAPLEMGDIAQRDAVIARYGELLRARLAAAGFEVVGGDEFSSLWNELLRSAGGFYDPITGHLDYARHAAARREALRRLRERHDISAIVFPSIVSRDATFQSGVAKWDGAEQIITGAKSKMGAMFGASGRYLGQLRALSLKLRFVDPQDTTLFEDYGGIHTLSRFEVGRFIELPVTQLFTDATVDARAVELSLAELIAPSGRNRRR